MCSASGRATPGLLSQLAKSRREILPSNMHTPWAGSNRYKISELMSFTAERPLPVDSPSLPFCVRFNVPLQRRRQHYGFTLLIDTLQHSILGLWLRATHAGSASACHQTISSPHVHLTVSSTATSHPIKLGYTTNATHQRPGCVRRSFTYGSRMLPASESAMKLRNREQIVKTFN